MTEAVIIVVSIVAFAVIIFGWVLPGRWPW